MTLWAALPASAWLGPMLGLVVTVAVFAALWRLSLRTRDCGVVDVYWAFAFAVIAWIDLACAAERSIGKLVLAALVTLWSLRLGMHLVTRHQRAAEEDHRYAAMRRRHGDAWPARSFWLVFMLQAFVLWIVALPIHAAMLATGPAHPALLGPGVLLFAVGLLLETVADAQLGRFKAVPANRGKLLTTGLFAWSRHPHYFGESLLWWGIGVFALGLGAHPAALLGPAILTALLLKVSGVPLLDEHLGQRQGHAAWAARTNAFLPWPPRIRRSDATQAES